MATPSMSEMGREHDVVRDRLVCVSKGQVYGTAIGQVELEYIWLEQQIESDSNQALVSHSLL